MGLDVHAQAAIVCQALTLIVILLGLWVIFDDELF